MNHSRTLTLAAAAALLLAGAAGAAFARPHPDADGDGDGKKAERIVVIRDRAGAEHARGEGREVRRFELVRDGKGERHVGADGVRRLEIHGADLVGCEGGEKIVDESADEGDKKTKVIVCTKGTPTADTARRLEEALARISANDDLSDEQKARIATALQSAIDRARSAR